MKKITILLMTLLLMACSNKVSIDDLIKSGDISKIKEEQARLKSEMDKIEADYNKVNKYLATSDSSKGKFLYVKSMTVKDTVFSDYIELQSNIETLYDQNISPEYSGVLNLRVREGQFIQKGALIGTISDGGVRENLSQAKIQVDMSGTQLKQAQIQADLARTTFIKQQNLWRQKIGSEMQFLQAKTNYEAAQKQVEIARQQISASQKGVSSINETLKKTNVYAPFSGIVETVITKSGQVVAPGVPIIRLISSSNLKAIAEVPEQYLENVKQGTHVIIEIPSISKKITSAVSLVSAAINPNNRSFKVEIPVNDLGGVVKPNLNAHIFINDYTNEQALVIKESSIKNAAANKYVYVIDNIKNNEGIAKKRIITVGKTSNGLTEVLSGLKANEHVITEYTKSMKEGDRVKIYND